MEKLHRVNKFEQHEKRKQRQQERERDLAPLIDKIRQTFPGFTEEELRVMFPSLPWKR